MKSQCDQRPVIYYIIQEAFILFGIFLIKHHSMDPFYICKAVIHFIRDNVKKIYQMHFIFFRKQEHRAQCRDCFISDFIFLKNFM